LKSDTHEPTLSTDELTLSTGEPAPGESEPGASASSGGQCEPKELVLSEAESAPGEGELMPDASESAQEAQDFLVKEPLIRLDNVRSWLLEQVPLVQCFFVAVSVHITFLPIMWIMGWALPWPKPPVFTTVVEYDLTNWPKVAKPKKVTDYQDPELND
jgi:hypothetical protein